MYSTWENVLHDIIEKLRLLLTLEHMLLIEKTKQNTQS